MAKRYIAFISYAHTDERWARWLHRSLERFRVPRKLRREPREGPGAGRLQPVFRDRDELASASDLSEAIRSALEQSDNLIVVCSPDAAKSRWVNEEVRCFQRLGRSKRIFCLVVAGSTNPDDSNCAFPTALLHAEDGRFLPEPLAADITEQGDGKRNAILRVAAGLLNVGVDDLRQRDAQRQLRVRSLITGTSLIVSLVTIAFAIAASLARQEADLRRTQAEGLISFMLEDLRSGLEPVGRLDLLDAIGDQAMEYFAALGGRGTQQEVFARSMALRQIGEVRFRQGRLTGAQLAFEQSRDIAAELFATESNNRQYLFELGQAEFWVGYVAHERSRLQESQAAYRKYMEYSRDLVALEPDNPDYQLELMYAYSNLGSWELDNADPAAALAYFMECLALNQQLVDAAPNDPDLRHELGNTFSWVAETQLQLGRLEDSERSYRSAAENLYPLYREGTNRLAAEHYGQNLYHIGTVLAHRGEIDQAVTFFRDALNLFDDLVEFDDENAIWRSDRGISAYHLAELLLVRGNPTSARNYLNDAIADFEDLVASNPGDLRVVEYLAMSEQLLASELAQEAPGDALTLSNASAARMENVLNAQTVKPRTVLNAAIVARLHGEVQRSIGEEVGAISAWRSALDLLDGQRIPDLAHIAMQRQLYLLLGDEARASELERRLRESGFFDPRFLPLDPAVR